MGKGGGRKNHNIYSITFCRVFGTTSSFISELSHLWKPLPMVALGVPAVITACLSLTLPETRGKALPQTLEEALTINVQKTDAKIDLKRLSKVLKVPQADIMLTSSSPSSSSLSSDEEEASSSSRFLSEIERRRLLTR